MEEKKRTIVMFGDSLTDYFPMEKLKDIDDLMPDVKKTIQEKVEEFLEKSDNQPYAHLNEGYMVVVKMNNEIDATDALISYLKKRIEMVH